MSEKKPKICRITNLRDFSGVIVGRDLGDVLEKGYVYSVKEIYGVIMLTKLGEHAVPEWLQNSNGLITGNINQLATSGVTYLTVGEYEKEKEIRE